MQDSAAPCCSQMEGEDLREPRCISCSVYAVPLWLAQKAWPALPQDKRWHLCCRAQDPPCPWNAQVCTAAADSSHLAVLLWLRAQDPPCPWSKRECLNYGRPAVVREWIAQQPGG